MNIKKYRKEYYQKNKKEIDAKNRQWVVNNPTRVKVYQKRFNQTPRGIYSTIKTNCYNKKREFSLNINDFLSWYKNEPKECHYCQVLENALPDSFKRVSVSRTGIVSRLTIDRKNNDKGYVIGNIVLSCSQCNRTKGEFLTHEEMLEVGKVIKKKWNKNKAG